MGGSGGGHDADEGIEPERVPPSRDAEPGPSNRKPGMYLDPTAQVGQSGVDVAAKAFRKEIGWIFRNQPTDDFGIDAHAEVVHDDGLVSGRLIGMQIKAGNSSFDEPTEGGWVFRSDSKHLSYWLGHALPVIVVLVDDELNAYWQAVRTDTVRETKKGFALTVPRSQSLGASAKDALLEVAGRSMGLVELMPEYKAVLPGGAVRRLSLAEARDALGAARLAERLATGRHQPDLTVRTILSSRPSWVVDSPAVDHLWWAVGSFATSHGLNALGAEVFQVVSDLDPIDGPRALAFSGLCLLFLDRNEARERLELAKAKGQPMLADVGLAALDFPADDARAFDLPASIARATDAELDVEPTVLNFLAEMASRREELTPAVRFFERAVAASTDDDSTMRNSLALALGRRHAFAPSSSKDLREGVAQAQIALESRRRWDGPTVEILGTLLDLHVVALDGTAGATAALPASRGGTASDAEASDPAVGRRGAIAALIAHRKDDYDWFLSQLPPGPERTDVEITAEMLGASGPGLAHDVARIQRLLVDASDDTLRVRCISKLVQLGVWPAAADDLLSRSIMQPKMHEAFRAIYTAASGDREAGISELRDVARRWPPAAQLLIELMSQDDLEEAIRECERQLEHWDDPVLTVVLADLHRSHGGDVEAAAIVERSVTNQDLSVDVRVGFCRWYTSRKAAEKDHPAAAKVARIGLGLRDDPDLAWDLVRALTNAGNTPAAREALDRYRPDPGSDGEVRLWLHLHVGVDLSAEEVRTMADLLRRQPAGELRDGMIGVLAREVILEQSADDSYPESLVEEVRELVEMLQPGSGSGTRPVSNDDALRAALEAELPDRTQWDKALDGIRRGITPLADAAVLARRPYGAALLQRPAGVIVASDLTPGVAAAAVVGAEAAVAEGACVVDLSALHLSNVIGRQARLRLAARLIQLHLTRSAAEDALRTRDAMRSLAAATYTAGLEPDGSISRTILSITERAALNDQAESLEESVAAAEAHWLDEWTNPARDALELAVRIGLPLWCDDCALQQMARARGVGAFGTEALAEVVSRSGGIDLSAIRLALAESYVIDLALTTDEMIELGERSGWRPGPLLTHLSRPGWWKKAGRSADAEWSRVAAAAVLANVEGFIELVRASMMGAIEAASAGRATQRYQQLLVLALVEFHLADIRPPSNLFDRIAEGALPGVPPKTEYVRAAVAEELARRQVAEPVEAALQLLPLDAGGAG